MLRIMFSVSVCLICVAFAAIEINRSISKGFSKSLISLASLVASIITGIFLSRILSATLGKLLIDYIKERTSQNGFIGGSMNIENVVVIIFQAVLGSVLFLITFLISRLLIALAVKLFAGRKLSVKKGDSVRFDRTAERKKERSLCIVSGALSGILLATALFSPFTGVLGMLRSIADITDKTEIEVWRKFGINPEKVERVTDYSRDPSVVFLSAMGGRMIYTASATATVNGKLISVPYELSIFENNMDTFSQVIGLFGRSDRLTEDDLKILEKVCRLADESEIFKNILTEFIQRGSYSWLMQGSIMSVPYPDISNRFRRVFDDVLRVCSGTSSYTVSNDLRTLVHVYAHILECGKSHNDVIEAITQSDVMTKISNELKNNQRTNSALLREEIYDIVVAAVSAKMWQKYNGSESRKYTALMRKITEAVNVALRDEDLTRDERIDALSDDLDTCFENEEITFDWTVLVLVASAMTDRFENSEAEIDVMQVSEFFTDNYYVSGLQYDDYLE